MAGPVLFLLLLVAMAAVGIAVASWSFSRRPDDATLAAGTVAFAYVFVPVHVLGWLGILTRAGLGVTLACLAAAVVLPTIRPAASRQRFVRTARAVSRFVAGGFIEPWRARSVALVGVVAVAALCLWTALLAYLAPSTSWDGLMYHEPMIGFALQNRGFDWVGIENSVPLHAQIDGFPRFNENVQLAFVVSWDRRVVDLVQTLEAPLLLAALTVTLRRFVRAPLVALGLASGLVLLPAVICQLRSSLCDVGFAAFVAVSLAWIARRKVEPASVWMLGLSLGLVGAAKTTSLFVVPVLGLVGLVVVGRAARRERRLWLHLAGAVLLVAGLMGPTFIRNVARTGNPIWPAIVDLEGVDVHLDGVADRLADQNHGLDVDLRWLFGPPDWGRQNETPVRDGYGHLPPFVLPPLALLGLGLALWRLRRKQGRDRVVLLLALAVPLVVYLAISPARFWGRLNLHVVMGLVLLAAYFVGQRDRLRLAEGVMGALIVGGLVSIYWCHPAWRVPPAAALELLGMSAEERVCWSDGGPMSAEPEFACAREAEIGDGDVVAVAGMTWLGALWNERYTNRVVHIDREALPGERWLVEAERLGAEWAIVSREAGLLELLRSDPRWEEVSATDIRMHGPVAFRDTLRR